MSAPEITTSFMVIQNLDGTVAVLTDTGMNQVREAGTTDLMILSHYVTESLKSKMVAAPQPKTPAQTLQERLAERKAQDEQG